MCLKDDRAHNILSAAGLEYHNVLLSYEPLQLLPHIVLDQVVLEAFSQPYQNFTIIKILDIQQIIK